MAAGAAVLLFLVAIAATPRAGAPWATAYAVALIALVAPATVWLAANAAVQGRAATRVCLFLGGISYPVYLLHIPVLSVIAGAGRAAGVDLAAYAPWPGLIVFALVVPLAWLVARWIDAPVRAWLLRAAAPGLARRFG